MDVDINDAGEGIITWAQNSGTERQIFKAQRSANGTWTLPSSTSEGFLSSAMGFTYPQATITSDGLIILGYSSFISGFAVSEYR